MRLVDDELLAEIEALQMQRRYADELLQDLKAERERIEELTDKYDRLSQTYHELRNEAESLQARMDAVKTCMRYQTTVEDNGQQVKVLCLLLEHVMEALGGDDATHD